jgi:hypothetical protein
MCNPLSMQQLIENPKGPEEDGEAGDYDEKGQERAADKSHPSET